MPPACAHGEEVAPGILDAEIVHLRPGGNRLHLQKALLDDMLSAK